MALNKYDYSPDRDGLRCYQMISAHFSTVWLMSVMDIRLKCPSAGMHRTHTHTYNMAQVLARNFVSYCVDAEWFNLSIDGCVTHVKHGFIPSDSIRCRAGAQISQRFRANTSVSLVDGAHFVTSVRA